MRLTDKNHIEMVKVEILEQKNQQDLLNSILMKAKSLFYPLCFCV